MITVKEAVESAVSFFKEVSTTAPRGLRVEEVMLSDNEEYWLITLGLLGDELILKPGHTEETFLVPSRKSEALAHRQYEREYKLFKVRREDGSVEDMTIRSLASQ
jgi:hypothetical protein